MTKLSSQSSAPASYRLELRTPLVLLMTTKHMGNLLVALHCVQEIVKASRGQSLVVIDESYRDIIEAATGIGKVLYYPRQRLKIASLRAKAKLLYDFYRQLRQHRATLLLDFDGQGQASTITQLSGIHQRIGPVDARRGKGVYSQQLADIERPPHRFNDYAQFLTTFLGQTPKPQYLRLSEDPVKAGDFATMLKKHGLAPLKPYVCIHVGATKAYKQWPIEHYAEIADWLADQDQQVVFIGAGDSDAERVSRVQAQCQQPHLNLCEQLSIRQLIALFQQCQFFLGNDSGPMHLAAAAGATVYAIFGPTGENRWGPLGHKARVIRNPMACESSCSKKLCPVNHRCINTLSAAQVKAVLQLHPF
ncbi:MAG: glycosyltransferase family 9 protein [Porticoccaceae bacterium]|nr:glycosyltransferase family 9 protein [Porticoccaceae bacterium]